MNNKYKMSIEYMFGIQLKGWVISENGAVAQRDCLFSFGKDHGRWNPHKKWMKCERSCIRYQRTRKGRPSLSSLSVCRVWLAKFAVAQRDMCSFWREKIAVGKTGIEIVPWPWVRTRCSPVLLQGHVTWLDASTRFRQQTFVSIN